MKVLKMVEVTLCDGCGEDGAWIPCVACQKEFCHACRDELVRYEPLVWFDSTPVCFCPSCHETMRGSRLLDALLCVRALRQEYTEWMRSFKSRMEAAQERVKEIHEEKG